MFTQLEIQLIAERCRALPPARNTYFEDDYVMNLFWTVLNFQMRNKAVERAGDFFRTHHWAEIRTLNDLQRVLSQYEDNEKGNTAVAQYLWGYRLWTRVSLLRKLVEFFTSIGVVTQEALRDWAKTSRYESDFKGKVPGMGLAIYKWLVMRQGVETVKPDIHLRRFVESIIKHDFTDRELVSGLEGVARNVGLKAYELDWRIWEYQRSKSLSQNASR